MNRKIGPPIVLVINPTGISAGAIISLATRSDNTNNVDPNNALKGNKVL